MSEHAGGEENGYRVENKAQRRRFRVECNFFRGEYRKREMYNRHVVAEHAAVPLELFMRERFECSDWRRWRRGGRFSFVSADAGVLK